MCIAIPMKVIAIDGKYAVCEYEGIRKLARIDFLSEIKVGEYVIIHTGFAIQKLDIEDALETIRIYKELTSGQTSEV
ncbi:MAG: HypC/HybG/HupF family hydrogenase formation chaperone [Endomicrobia bacterium]|nr:HypC/HybG/HupF family hydrogenase formation chaperone [Endomicrobiia bacterium]